MSEYITLLGAEDVQRAASTIASAAMDMRRAAEQIEEALRRHQQFLDEWLLRQQAALDPREGC